MATAGVFPVATYETWGDLRRQKPSANFAALSAIIREFYLPPITEMLNQSIILAMIGAIDRAGTKP